MYKRQPVTGTDAAAYVGALDGVFAKLMSELVEWSATALDKVPLAPAPATPPQALDEGPPPPVTVAPPEAPDQAPGQPMP